MPVSRDSGHPGPDTRAPARAQVSTRATLSSLLDSDFVIIDVETTGLGADSAITEIGALLVMSGRIADEFHSMVNPPLPIPRRITELTGITTEMVADADPIDVVFPRFIDWSRIDEDGPAPTLVAHNAPFDMGFLTRAALACNRPFPNVGIIDTLALSRVLLPRPRIANHRLATLADYFEIAQPHAHRALSDAYTTWQVLLALALINEERCSGSDKGGHRASALMHSLSAPTSEGPRPSPEG